MRFITDNLGAYLVERSVSLRDALEKINANKSRIVFVVDKDYRLLGSLSDGDVRRWLTASSTIDLSIGVGEVFNNSVVSVKASSSDATIKGFLSEKTQVLPLLDESNVVVKLALYAKPEFNIEGRVISNDHPSFIIAEIGNNHNGSLDLALEMVELAYNAGADCVKFQMRDLDSLYLKGSEIDDTQDLGAQYTLDLLTRFMLSTNEMFSVFDHCKKFGLTPLCTPWDLKSLEELERYGMAFYKVASADLTNHQLLKALAETKKPLIVSTGMSTSEEIQKSAQLLRSFGTSYIFLHCNSTYPTPFKDINLRYLEKLAVHSGGLVGYSGHERGIHIPIAAVSMGAKVIEKHFTVDKRMEGSDHKVSLLPEEFSAMVKSIRELEEALGSGETRELSQGELLNRENLAKSIIAVKPIVQGSTITSEMLDVKSPGCGLQPMYMENLVGKVAKRDFKVGDYFFESDLSEFGFSARKFSFSRPFGIPVRYHDYGKLIETANLDFIEFHLSYKDLDLDIANYFSEAQDIDFCVHSPELFANDHIMDLASYDPEYRRKSIELLNEVCSETRKLKEFFPKSPKPLIVINAGGFTEDGFCSQESKPNKYELVADALSRVDETGVEIIIQTMPPFPWHFGGQRYHNLFVDSSEIKKFCEVYSRRICFDTSHSVMACNYMNWDFEEFCDVVLPVTAHMHVVDAKGVDGEGVQIGNGDLDFNRFALSLKKHPEIQFLPEVWQGHKNGGEGFWQALDFLEKVKI